jgi:hypothetical protein
MRTCVDGAHPAWGFGRYSGLTNSRFRTLLFGINRLRSEELPNCWVKSHCSGAIVQLLCNQNFPTRRSEVVKPQHKRVYWDQSGGKRSAPGVGLVPMNWHITSFLARA